MNMAYRDKDKQREANRGHAKAYRARKKGMTQGMTGMTHQKIPEGVVSAVDKFVEKARSGSPLVAHHPTCRCLMCTG